MTDQIKEYDVLGVGFGPANLSIAIALEEQAQAHDLSYCFLEQKPQFEWHGGMLLDGTRMQISCLKDLVTQRNPTSPYSFINYLHAHGRLNSFINLGSLTPSRVEFNDYLTWVAKQFDAVAQYGQRVIDIEPIEEQGQIEKVRVVSSDIHGNQTVRIAKNLIISMGGMPKIPELFAGFEDDKVVHSSRYKVWRDQFDTQGRAPKIAVVGAGQSAAEIFVDLTNRHEAGEVHLVNRNFALHPADDSAFVNEIFNPEFTDHVYDSNQDERKHILARFAGTNYSVVDTEELNAIYERLYMQQVTGEGSHQHLRCHDIQEVGLKDSKVSLRYHDRIHRTQMWQEYDAVVLATGYRYDMFNQMLNKLEPMKADKQVERRYRLPMKENCQVNVFLQGCCETSHGLSDTLLSVLAVRSQEVVDSLLANTDKHKQAVSA
ncbi:MULTISPECIES: lysine N(6)-hydroxylase/L-ornithine N(5)-oxygenase family protein [Vibrio]|uniref:L-ornithine N5-oxygenase n=1 Tax=Vibrio proteolyticus NBRC 13287 TaxID=1219065 RepID=U3BFT9_VIBPR|nr:MULTISPECIES: lysine N(6)-hydroxylase/L-ornithine N(5)-oxygenase family protein [Vibrio]NAW57844.1 SidA/IucD/PvdA family monooxygenase [Vibrio sp. V36_P2S2PM302]NAX20452.1 SidA/IucD/PvdA family monooxygenase [Vibrio sp. V39_P1S14PM300]NAX28384.1 SidA/IucD/PvdA family monooxygenase [Vibrio sp. V38_P2S17PM301]NAX30134.1 SidA/IucD/PvdA family monooxygenase [Vibrio sp. V37_P2S8PM304]GAD65583.1 L-ornithine N5-oxygenase [Vibrio proteolyticus NBRC 13287]